MNNVCRKGKGRGVLCAENFGRVKEITLLDMPGIITKTYLKKLNCMGIRNEFCIV